METKRAILIIMDGWGEEQSTCRRRHQHANTPFVDSLYEQYPHSSLITCGEDVGLPEGQMGNSEVGHLNIGAGRIVYQELQRINVAVRTGELAANTALQASMDYALNNDKPFHLIGLVSDGGSPLPHQSPESPRQHCTRARGLKKVFIHAFTDGRDTDPKSGLGYLEDLQAHLQQTTGSIASVTGRYYAMDRDKRWERVKLAYDALVLGQGTPTHDLLTAIKASYAEGITDEFIKPIIVTDEAQKPIATIQEGDAVLCFNFRDGPLPRDHRSAHAGSVPGLRHAAAGAELYHHDGIRQIFPRRARYFR